MADHFDPPATANRPRWTTVAALVSSIGLAGFMLAACGGSSTKAASATTAGTSSAAASAGASSAAGSSSGTAATTAAASTASSSAAGSTAVPHGNSSSSFCSFARQVSSQQSKNVAVFTAGNPAAIERLEKQELSVLTFAVSTAPASIRPAMVVIANADQALYKDLKAAKFDFRKLSPSALKDFDSAALTKASETVTSYITNVCHISTASPTH